MSKTIISTSALALVRAAANEGATGSNSSEAAAPANRALAILTDETKVNSIKKAMPARKTYDSLEAAISALEKASAATESFHGLPVAVTGMNYETGEIDSTLYAGNAVILAYVGGRAESASNKDKNIVGIKGVAIYPQPPLASFIDSEEGKTFLSKIVEKEAALVAFRNFRESATLYEFQQGVSKVASSVSALIADSQRGGNGLDTETFDALWSDMRTALKQQMPALVALFPSKQEVIKAIRSASYAKSEHEALESKGVFVWLANVLIQAAESNTDAKTNEPNPMDASAIKSWLEGRESLNLTKAESKPADFSVLDSIQLPGFAE